jgi:hypothetical protein
VVTRALHGSIALVQLVAPDGAVGHLEKWVETDLAGLNPTTRGIPKAYLWRNNSLVFYPTPDSASYSYRLTYPRRPNKLVAPATAGVITVIQDAVNPTILSLTLNVTPASLSITTSTPCDIIQARPPFDSLVDDSTPAAIVGSAIQFNATAAARSALVVGDYVCLAEEAPVLQMPPEAHVVLAHRVAMTLVPPEGSLWKKLAAELRPLEEELYGGLADRDQDEPDHLANEAFW